MSKQELAAIAKAMVAPGRGLLAMDESNRTGNKRFEDVGLAPTEENRRAYRKLILTTRGLGTSISGAMNILEIEWREDKEGSRRVLCPDGAAGFSPRFQPEKSRSLARLPE
jgi:fructose-bisphosphate aldolase, class I